MLGMEKNLGKWKELSTRQAPPKAFFWAYIVYLIMASRHTDNTDNSQNQQSNKRKISRSNLVSTRHSISRKRAVIACQPCRAKKAKCDNQRPTCSRCQAQESECVYEDTNANVSWVYWSDGSQTITKYQSALTVAPWPLLIGLTTWLILLSLTRAHNHHLSRDWVPGLGKVQTKMSLTRQPIITHTIGSSRSMHEVRHMSIRLLIWRHPPLSRILDCSLLLAKTSWSGRYSEKASILRTLRLCLQIRCLRTTLLTINPWPAENRSHSL